MLFACSKYNFLFILKFIHHEAFLNNYIITLVFVITREVTYVNVKKLIKMKDTA